MNFLQRLALQEKKLDDNLCLNFVEIACVPDMLLSLLASFLVGLWTYQHPRYMLILIMKMKHSANYMVHMQHVNINNEKIYIYITISKLDGANAVMIIFA